MFAAKNGHVKCLGPLLSRKRIGLGTKDTHGGSALHVATLHGQPAIMRHLMAYIVMEPVDLASLEDAITVSCTQRPGSPWAQRVIGTSPQRLLQTKAVLLRIPAYAARTWLWPAVDARVETSEESGEQSRHPASAEVGRPTRLLLRRSKLMMWGLGKAGKNWSRRSHQLFRTMAR